MLPEANWLKALLFLSGYKSSPANTAATEPGASKAFREKMRHLTMNKNKAHFLENSDMYASRREDRQRGHLIFETMNIKPSLFHVTNFSQSSTS